jgi:hypothetical protein
MLQFYESGSWEPPSYRGHFFDPFYTGQKISYAHGKRIMNDPNLLAKHFVRFLCKVFMFETTIIQTMANIPRYGVIRYLPVVIGF